MKTEICLLDLNYEEMDGNISVILYGRTPDRKRVVVVDPTYEPYFYLLPKNLNCSERGKSWRMTGSSCGASLTKVIS
jgi:hypothetical protein